jgi:hypothetical protein
MGNQATAGALLLLATALLAGTFATACGAVAETSTPGADDGGDGDAANGPVNDGGPPDALAPRSDSGLPEQPRCDGGATTAPGGGACDASRLLVVHRGGSAACIATGDFCDVLDVVIAEADLTKLPAGFECNKPDRGYVQCHWPLGPVRLVDTAALDGACAATVALADVRVRCVILD